MYYFLVDWFRNRRIAKAVFEVREEAHCAFFARQAELAIEARQARARAA